MSKPQLRLPRGLFLQVLCQVVRPPTFSKAGSKGNEDEIDKELQRAIDEINDTPMALLARAPRPGTYYFGIRAAEVYPTGSIVECVSCSPEDGSVGVRLDVDAAGEPTFVCERFEVTILRLFSNIDILVRAGSFLAAAIQVLKLTMSHGPKNLEVVYDLMSWWKEPANRVSSGDLRAAPDWIRQEFQDRQSRIDAGLEIQNPRCFESLVRELLFDAELTNQLKNRLRKETKRTMSPRSFVEPVLHDVAYSVFRNAADWHDKTMRQAQETGQPPNWFGYADAQAKGKADRQLKRDAGKRAHPQLPYKQGRALLDAVDPKHVFTSIELAVAAVTSTSKPVDAYYGAKATLATARYHLATQSLARSLTGSPTPDERRKGTMALLRAIDEQVWRKCRTPDARPVELASLVRQHVAQHLQPGFHAEPKHARDRTILDSLELHGSAPPAQPRPTTVDGLAIYILRDELEQRMEKASLTAEERAACLYKYGLSERPPNKTDGELLALQRRALAKLRKAVQEDA